MNKDSMPALKALYQELKMIFEPQVTEPKVPAPQPKPVPTAPAQPVTTQPAPEKPAPVKPKETPVKTKKAFTEQQINAMKVIKDKLQITENAQIGPFVERWSDGKLRSVTDLNGDNIDDFMGYLKTLL